MASVRTRSVIIDVESEVDDILAIVGNNAGNIYYVTNSGSDSNNGTSWATAFLTLIYAISQCTSGQRDVIFIAPGTYDETANGVTGIPVDKASLLIRGVGKRVSITNSNTVNNGRVFYVTADYVVFSNISIEKGETTSTGTILITYDGCTQPFLINCHLHIHSVDETGVKLTGGTRSAFIGGIGNDESRIHGHLPLVRLGIGIDFDDCIFCTTGLLHLENLVTAAVFREDGDSNMMLPSTVISACTTGISLESGAVDNSLPCMVTACTTEYIDLSGNATNDKRDSTNSQVLNVDHIPKFTGTIRFVSDARGLDTNSGLSPEEPFATIGNAINNSVAGDAIIVEAGDYYETDLDLNLIGLELWGEIGANIYNTTGTALTVSARNCRVREIVLIAVGQIALDLTANYCVIEALTCAGPATGIALSGLGNRLRDVTIGAPTTTGVDISGPFNELYNVIVSNAAVAARGFYLSSDEADQNSLEDCHSIGNTIAGFEVVYGADYNSFIKCTSGGGDGKRIDAGDFNLWDIVEQLTTEHNEQMHPFSDGQGTAGDPITVDNTATDDTPDTRSDQNYWGDTVAIILPDVLTTFWESIGIYIFATTTGKTLQWQIWFPNGKVTSDRNAGNAWDLGETQLTVDDASLFLANDLVWIRSDSDPNGEILEVVSIAGNVITIASETRFSGNTGVRYDHVGNEAMYLIYRATDDRFSGIEGGYAASSAKDSFREIWHEVKELPRNSAMIMRVLNTADNLDAEFDVNALYEM